MSVVVGPQETGWRCMSVVGLQETEWSRKSEAVGLKTRDGDGDSPLRRCGFLGVLDMPPDICS